MELTTAQIISTLHEKAGDTMKELPIIRWRTEFDPFNPDAGRTYDHDKITDDLVGKHVHIEVYSVARNADKMLCGCYREITGTVKEIIHGGSSIIFIVFTDGKVLDPFKLTDIKITVQ